jgi:hypothetical protein
MLGRYTNIFSISFEYDENEKYYEGKELSIDRIKTAFFQSLFFWMLLDGSSPLTLLKNS